MTTLTSITATTESRLDVTTLWNDHVDRWTWIGMGAKLVARGQDHLALDIHLGAGTRTRRLIIKLNGDDLYDIEIGHLTRRTLEWVIDAQVLNVHAEDLDGALRGLYDDLT
jgi:hypothetical protein